MSYIDEEIKVDFDEEDEEETAEIDEFGELYNEPADGTIEDDIIDDEEEIADILGGEFKEEDIE